MSAFRDHFFNGTDDLTQELQRKTDALKQQLVVRLGSSKIPSKPDNDWATDIRELHARWLQMDAEIERRNSRRCSMQVTAFLRSDEEGLEADDAARRWWWNRY